MSAARFARQFVTAAMLALALSGGGTAAAATPLPDLTGKIDLREPGWGNSRAGQYLAGRFAEQSQDRAQAARFLELALGHDPNDLALRRHVFYLMVAEGKIAAARQHANAVLWAEPGSFLALSTLGGLAMEAGKFGEALSLFGQLDGGGHNGMMRALGQAWAAAGAGDMAAAKAVMNFPMETPGWKGLRDVHQALIEDFGSGDAKAAYAVLTAKPSSISPRLRAIIENFEARQADPAVPPMIGSAAEGLAQAYSTIAAALTQARQNLTGIVYAQLGLHLSPNDTSLLLLLADSLQDQDRFLDAADVYGRLSPQTSYYYPAQVARAHNLAQADRVDDAIALLVHLTEEFADQTGAAAALGDLLRRQKQFEEAEAAYNKAFARIGNAGSPEWQLFYTRGITRERLGNWPGAEADFSAALAIEKEQPLVLNYLGYSWIDRGENLERAKAMVRRAAEIRPKDGFIADSVGWAAYRTGDMEEAVRELERAILLEPLDPTINEHLGDVYWIVGRKTEARFQWQRALSFEPEPERIAGLNERLACNAEPCAPLAKDRKMGAQ